MVKFGNNDDLFESSTMTFGEHLDELRVCLVRAAMGLAVGVAIGLFLGQYVVQFFNAPLERAIIRYKVLTALDKIAAQYPKDTEEAEENRKINKDVESGQAHIPPNIIHVVKQERLIPEAMLIDPVEMINNMAPVLPAAAMGMTVDPWSFSVNDVIYDDYPGLCKVLLAAKDRPANSPEKWLHDQATPKELAAFATIVLQTKTQVLNLQKNIVLGYLNRLVNDEKFSNEKAFAALKSKLEADGKEPRQLRREMLVAALPDYLAMAGGRKLVSIPVYRLAVFEPMALNAQEPFMIWLQAGFVLGCVIAGPWVFWQAWNFVAAGLYPHEKRYVHIYLPFSIALFFCGAALVFLFVLDPVLDFFLGYNRSMGIAPDIRQSEWLGFVLILPLAFGVSFQLPLIMLFLNRIGVVSMAMYLSHWRIATLVIFVISMVLTPTMDPWTMLFMAVPLMFLYVGGLLLCLWMPRGKGLFPAAYDP
jgi:sec-independent protein translocase protein TatC